jgi:HAD superfamily hydrolase (TIGR01509 family)
VSGDGPMSASATAPRPAPVGASPRTVRAALFDWDGTLVDSRAVLLAAWRESTAQVLGRSYPQTPAEENLVFTLPGSRIWPTLARERDQLDALVVAFQSAYEASAGEVRTFPGVKRMLEALRAAGLSIAVVTSKARRRYGPDASHAGIATLIDVAICAEDTDGAKPDPTPVLRALERFGVRASLAVMIGDTPVDVAAGIAAGTRTIGVAWGHAGEAELRAAGAERVADDPAQLTALLLGGAPATAAPGARKA